MDEVCDRFEAARRAGQEPRIEDFLALAPESDRRELLRQLLKIEIELRREGDEKPTAGEYAARFPEHAELIPGIFQDTPSLGEAAEAVAGSGNASGTDQPSQTGKLSSESDATSSVAEMSRVPEEATGDAGFPDLPKYEVLAEAGRGGMGIVYRARHRILKKTVAIKVLLPGKSRKRFLREAQLLATVSSPYVVAVHDFDVLPDGAPLLCMEWIEGQNLLQAMRAHGCRLPEEIALRWMREVCEGMEAAANQGVIHRDLKPSNILIDARGQARVADFGLARGPEPTVGLSRTGVVVGTSLYMAPEQAEDPRSVDSRADIYSFGATFYHALTGRPPFEGETDFSVLYKHKTEPLISPRARRPDLSERVNALLERCLAKSPADRFPWFAEILRHLQPALATSSPWVISDDKELTAYIARYQSRRSSYLSEREAWEEDLDIYTLPRGQILRIRRGNIVTQLVDALVSSDTSDLGMDFGVSGAIAQAGGREVRLQARRLAPVRPGRVAVTSGGSLPARLVFHGVTVGFTEETFVEPSRDLIAEIMASCFYHADSHDIRSIAFPLLGAGAMGFPRDVCLDTMFQFLARMLLRGLTSVKDARIILFD
jgi:serine/threonine protein kinase